VKVNKGAPVEYIASNKAVDALRTQIRGNDSQSHNDTAAPPTGRNSSATLTVQ
jgi:hypothetical protein